MNEKRRTEYPRFTSSNDGGHCSEEQVSSEIYSRSHVNNGVGMMSP